MYAGRTGIIDHAEQMGAIIFPFDKNGKPILFEILDASEFLVKSTKVAMDAKEGEKVEI